MNSYSICGIFVFLLSAYYAPTQGQRIAVSEVVFEDGDSCRSTNLIQSSDGTWKIEGNGREFGITGIDTILGRDVVLRTNNGSFVQMELVNAEDAQQLFALTTRSKLGKSKYSYRVLEVYEHPKGRIYEKVRFSGYEYSTTGKPQVRFIVHSENSAQVQPLLLWTEEQFNFEGYDESILLSIRAKPVNKIDKYYLVKFRGGTDQTSWMRLEDGGRSSTGRVPLFPHEVLKYFLNYSKV